MDPFAVIIPAAGASRRFGGGNKLLALLDGEPVIRRTVRAFARRADVACVVIATSGDPTDVRAALSGLGEEARILFCEGGDHRAQSVQNALAHVSAHGPGDQSQIVRWVAVHDAARPLVSQELIAAAFAAALEHGAAVPAMPISLTVKQAQGPLPAQVERTIPRQTLWAMQTPQVMRRQSLVNALRNCPIPLDQITDDAQAIELAGEPVWLIPGEQSNLKITTADDLALAHVLLRAPS